MQNSNVVCLGVLALALHGGCGPDELAAEAQTIGQAGVRPTAVITDRAHDSPASSSPVRTLIDRDTATYYSSVTSSTAAPDPPIEIDVTTSAPVIASAVLVNARMVDGKKLAFPAKYEVFITTPDGASWLK